MVNPEQMGNRVLEHCALQLVDRYGSRLRAQARKFSLCEADAEDAYQRSFEVLMAKAPARELSQLLPWMLTVVMHEAKAVRRRRLRQMAHYSGERVLNCVESPDEVSERREQLKGSYLALAKLKSQEVTCLALKAKGYSYKEISEITGFSWTKVNRCLSEGRSAFKRLTETEEQV